MKKHVVSLSILLAGLMSAIGAVHAQSSSASGTSDVPTKAGEASTTTRGAPNAQTSTGTAGGGAGMSGGSTGMSGGSTGAVPASRDQVRSDAKDRGGAASTSSVPGKGGEASTMVNGRPNANPDAPTVNKSAAERRTEREMKRADSRSRREAAVMSQKGAQAGAEAGTPAVSPAGTPPVQKGGTPK